MSPRRPPRPAAEALGSLENRLRSFLLMHEALRRQNYRGVPVSELAEKLAQRLRNAWDVERRIELRIEGESGVLGEQQGFALALVLNELLTNAFRHAFPQGRHGTLTIRFATAGDTFRLEVEDDGVGTAADTSSVVGSGRSIIDALVGGELGGAVDFRSTSGGTRVTVTLPHSRPADRSQP